MGMKRVELNGFEAEARAGVPDETIARLSGASIRAVANWRRSRGIKHRTSFAGSSAGQHLALRLLATDYVAATHSVGSVFRGNWTPPEFVIRVPLDYTAFCRVVAELSSYSATALSQALGIREHDITSARVLWAKYLNAKGQICRHCNKLVDPKHRC